MVANAKPKPKLKKRKPGEKKKPKGESKRLLKLPPFPGLREPGGMSALAEFLTSLEGEVPVREAIKEFQEWWCEHPRKSLRLLSTSGSLVEQDFRYVRICTACGLQSHLKGRAPSWLAKQ